MHNTTERYVTQHFFSFHELSLHVYLPVCALYLCRISTLLRTTIKPSLLYQDVCHAVYINICAITCKYCLCCVQYRWQLEFWWSYSSKIWMHCSCVWSQVGVLQCCLSIKLKM